MSYHLERTHHDPTKLCLQQLSFRPIVETIVVPTEEDDQITLKLPTSTLHHTRRPGGFLKSPFPEEASPQPSPITQEQQGRLLSTYQLAQEHLHKKTPVETTKVDERPPLNMPASKPVRRKQFVELPGMIRRPLQEGEPQEPQRRNSRALVVEWEPIEKLQTVPLPSVLETTQDLNDDAEFEKRSTLPMMVLTGIAIQQGKPKPEMPSEVSNVAGAAGLQGLGSTIGSVLRYAGNFLIQYGFGPGGYGLYTLSLSLVSLISAVFNLGLDDAAVRFVAIYRSKQQPKSLRGVLIFCTALAGSGGIIAAVLLLFFAPILVTYWINFKQHHVANNDTLNHAIALLRILAPVIPLTTMQVVWFAGLRGFKAFKWRVLSSSILQPSLMILLLGLILLFFQTGDGIVWVAIASLIGTLFNTALSLYFLFREVSHVSTPEPEHYEVREWLTFASLNFLTTIVDTILDSIDTILLAVFGIADVAIGQYGAAIRLGGFIALPLSSINNVFAPTIAELHSQGEMQKLESIFKLTTKWTTTFTLPLFLIMVLFSPYLMALPGSGFASAWPLLIAFSVGSMINAGTGAVGYVLLMTGYQRLSFLNSLVAVVVNIGLGILLTPRYGAMGTAISTGLAICALNLMRLLQVRLLLKMHPYRLDVLKPVAAGLISAAPVVGLLYLFNVGHVQTAAHVGHAILFIQLLLIPVFLAGYIALVRQFKSSPEDEIVLKALRKKFLGGKKKNKMLSVSVV